jgi:hypothetical protein
MIRSWVRLLHSPFRGLVILSLASLVLLANGCSRVFPFDRVRPSQFLIPEGYVGWVRVEYSVPGTPPLPIADGYYVIRIPANGRLKTSTKKDLGWADNQYYYVSGKTRQPLKEWEYGKDSMVWDNATSSAGDDDLDTVDLIFFIGTKAQYHQFKGKKGEWSTPDRPNTQPKYFSRDRY